MEKIHLLHDQDLLQYRCRTVPGQDHEAQALQAAAHRLRHSRLAAQVQFLQDLQGAVQLN